MLYGLIIPHRESLRLGADENQKSESCKGQLFLLIDGLLQFISVAKTDHMSQVSREVVKFFVYLIFK